jgi:hypothetical protein
MLGHFKNFDDKLIWAFKLIVIECLFRLLNLPGVVNDSITTPVNIPHDLIAYSLLTNDYGATMIKASLLNFLQLIVDDHTSSFDFDQLKLPNTQICVSI